MKIKTKNFETQLIIHKKYYELHINLYKLWYCKTIEKTGNLNTDTTIIQAIFNDVFNVNKVVLSSNDINDMCCILLGTKQFAKE